MSSNPMTAPTTSADPSPDLKVGDLVLDEDGYEGVVEALDTYTVFVDWAYGESSVVLYDDLTKKVTQ